MIRIFSTVFLLGCAACQPLYPTQPVRVQAPSYSPSDFYYARPRQQKIPLSRKDSKTFDDIAKKIDHIQQKIDTLRARLSPTTQDTMP